MTLKCKACGHKISDNGMNEYYVCPSCGTATYVTFSNSFNDNKKYFNTIYADRAIHPIEKRMKLFERYLRIDTLLHRYETANFAQLQKKITEIIITSEKTVEIGFGSGAEIVRHLRAGANVYGVDISQEAVNNFQSNYPEYSSRVSCAMSYDFRVDVVYSNALFEHLDHPGEFLENAHNMLNPCGCIIIRLPVITKAVQDRREVDTDINFWKPCHRALYTLKGLNIILGKHGFKMVSYASLAYYGYKVMSRILRLGYKDIIYVRNPYYHINGLASSLLYHKILLQSLFDRVICSDFVLIAEKHRANNMG